MLKKKIAGKKGGTIIIIVMMLALLFPIIIMGIIDITNVFKIQKRLKTVLNASVKSASSRVDWNYVPDGEFKIDRANAEEVFVDIFNSNMEVSLEKEEDYYKCESAKSKKPIRLYFDVYNERHEGDYVNFPKKDVIPPEVTSRHFYTPVDRPTAIVIAKVEYKTSPLLGGKVLDIVQFASSQLNIAPDVGKTIESNIGEGSFSGGELNVNPNLIGPGNDYTSSNSYFEVTKTSDKLNGYPVFKVQKKNSTSSPIQIGTINIAVGEVYTASVWIKADKHSVIDYTSLLGFYKNGESLSTTQTSKVGEWVRLKVTLKNDSGNVLSGVNIYLYPSKPNGSVTYFSYPKIEKGQVATD